MKTRTAKTATFGAIAAMVAVALLAYLAVATSASAQSATTSTTTSTSTSQSQQCNYTQSMQGQWQGTGASFQWNGGPPAQYFHSGPSQGEVNLTVGETITVASTSGEYYVAGASNTNGSASGTITFTVTGKLSQGYTLSITGGSLTIAGTTYTIASGSAQMDPSGATISGQGTTSQNGSFIIRASAHGTFVGSTASVSLDFSNGTTEYLVTLTGSV